MEPLVLNEHEAAAALKISVQLLRKLRGQRRGPKFVRLVGTSAIRYPVGDLLCYVRESALPMVSHETTEVEAASI